MKKRMLPDEYFMRMAQLAAARSTCLRRQVGAVIVKDKRVLATGYNGAPRGMKHCAEVGCLRAKLKIAVGERHELCRGVHAEQNAVIQAAIFGVSIKDATIYTTNYPCSMCSRILINSGISEIVYAKYYRDPYAERFLKEAGIRVRKYSISESSKKD